MYNVGTGFGFIFDLHTINDLTRDSPLLLSKTPKDFYSYRYSHWVWVDREIWVYAEATNENRSHEIRLTRLSVK